jgi:hypothetical protein
MMSPAHAQATQKPWAISTVGIIAKTSRRPALDRGDRRGFYPGGRRG